MTDAKRQRIQLIRSTHINQVTETKKGQNHMSTPSKPNKPSNAPSTKVQPATKSAAPSNGEPKSDKPKKAKRARVRFHSKKEPKYWVRAYKDIVDQFGAPVDPWGQTMEPRAAVAFGITPEERAARKAAKEAEKLRIQSMSEEEQLAYAKTRREAKQAKRDAKRAAEKAALVESVRAELIASGELVPATK